MTSATPPLISSKHEKNVRILLLQSRMKSLHYLIFILCAVVLFGTVLYFGIKDYKYQDKLKESKETPNAPGKNLAVTLEKESEPKTAEHPEEHNEKTGKEGKNLERLLYTEKEGEITESEGALLLKTVLKNMVCVMGEASPYSISCCGMLPHAEDGSEDHACLLMDSFEVTGSKEKRHYRLRFTIEKDLVIYEEVTGFPKPGRKCYPLPKKYGEKKLCASINFISLDNDFSNDTDYETCTFMNFGFGPTKTNNSNDQRHQLLGYAENVKCNIDKDTITKKSLYTPFGVVFRLKFGSDNEENGKEMPSDFIKHEIENENKTMGSQQQKVGDNDKKPVVIILSTNNSQTSQPELTQEPKHENILLGNSGNVLSESSSSEEIRNEGLVTAGSEMTGETQNQEYGETGTEPISEEPENQESNETQTPDDGAAQETGVHGFLHRILDFIRNHILSMFRRNSDVA